VAVVYGMQPMVADPLKYP